MEILRKSWRSFARFSATTPARPKVGVWRLTLVGVTSGRESATTTNLPQKQSTEKLVKKTGICSQENNQPF